MADAPQQFDPAPWWVREMRPYGLTGLLLAASCWFVFDTNARKDRQIDAKDALIAKMGDAMIAALNESSKSNWTVVSTLQALRDDLKK
jgi:hypothetical protein